jgi:opacity protein-like surface antigen
MRSITSASSKRAASISGSTGSAGYPVRHNIYWIVDARCFCARRSNAHAVSGAASLHLTDYGTVRLRGGWAYENFMPYGFIGFAVGRASIARSASVFISAVDANPGCVGPPDVCLPPYSFSQSESDIKNNAFAYGWAAGGGMDWALTRISSCAENWNTFRSRTCTIRRSASPPLVWVLD